MKRVAIAAEQRRQTEINQLMEFTTPVHITPSDFKIGYATRGVLMGSCFTEEIGKRMQLRKIPVTINPTGVLFNPSSIAETLSRFATGVAYEPSEILQEGSRWVSLGYHGNFTSDKRQTLIEGITAASELGKKSVYTAEYLLITWGSAWVYEYRPTGRIVANCHRLPSETFLRRRLSVEEIVTQWSGLIETHLCNKQLIFTVSPIRHLRDGLPENQLSKATLILAVHQLCEKYPQVHYFPAYEILQDELRDYRFYDRDLIHPSEVAADYIWERFREGYLAPDAIARFEAIEILQRAILHRPLHPDNYEFQLFCKRMLDRISLLEKLYPDLSFETENLHFTHALRSTDDRT